MTSRAGSLENAPGRSARSVWSPAAALRRLASGVLTREALPYAVLVAAALALRLVALPDRAFHHDESQHGYFSWLFATGGGYHFDPILHGPLRDLVTGAVFFLFGAGDTTARLVPALLGAAIVALPFGLRRQLGPVACLAASALLCVSPAFLYFSRFEREDIFAIALTLALTVAVFRFLDEPRRWHPPLIFGLLAASFATKETTYITVFIAGTFFIAVAAFDLRQIRQGRARAAETRLLGPLVAVGRDAWGWAAAAFLSVYTILFTTFFTNPGGLQDGLVDSIGYWLSQQPVGRGDQPLHYYFTLLGAYELPAVVLGLVGAVAALRRRSLFRVYLGWSAVLSLAVYTWAGEKMPWLILHPLLPIVLLAGLGLETLWRTRRRPLAKAGLAAAGLAAAPMLWGGVAVNYRHSADPAELLVFTQSSPDVVRVRDRLVALNRRLLAETGRPIRLEIDQHYSMDWPWWWYLRDLRPAAAVMDDASYVPPKGTDALLVSHDNRGRLLPRLRAFRGNRFQHRVWWVPDYAAARPDDVLRWLVFREPWNPRGGLDEWLYVRRDLP